MDVVGLLQENATLFRRTSSWSLTLHMVLRKDTGTTLLLPPHHHHHHHHHQQQQHHL